MFSAKTNSTSYPLSDTAPLAIDLYCGLGGWAEGFLSEGYRVIGFDIEAHDYGTGGYPGELVIQDVRTLHGSQFKDAAVIVASPPCQAYSYRAMPWKRAKALPPPDNTLFEQPFRIQREACEAAGRYIPLIVENVRGAQKWVGPAKWHFGSYYIWGDIPALMPPVTRSGVKVPSLNWKVGSPTYTCKAFNSTAEQRLRRTDVGKGARFNSRDCGLEAAGIKQHGSGREWFVAPGNISRETTGGTLARSAASALIAKIPFPLAQHIARVFKPVLASLLLLALVNPCKPSQKGNGMFVLSELTRKSYPVQLSLNFNVTKEHVPNSELYGFLTPVCALTSNQQSEVRSTQSEPGALPPTLEELAKKFRPLIDRVLSRLSEAEQREANLHLKQDYRQAWITASYAQRMSDAFIQASYSIYGKHPDQIWPSIVDDRKARLGAEYYEWYGSDDLLRPDLPKIPPRPADTHSAHEAGLPGTETGLVPNPERKTV